MSEPAPFPEDPFSLLEHGTIEGIELIPWGSNYTFAALLRADDGSCCYGVYKPRRGEVPLRDFASGTLYKREVAAYVFATQLGWDLVPPTVMLCSCIASSRADCVFGVARLISSARTI